jgi:hypothetical protein
MLASSGEEQMRMMCLTTRKLSAVNSQGREIKYIKNSMFLKKGGNEKKEKQLLWIK